MLLKDIGERDLTRRINQLVVKSGAPPLNLDDCGILGPSPKKGIIVATTDPCPVPNFVQKIGLGDFKSAGWLCVVKSLSDIAAAGAKPMGIFIGIEFPLTMPVSQFDDFFSGVLDATNTYNTRLIGGNLKESMGNAPKESKKRYHAESFAVGITEGNNVLSRGQVYPNDIVGIVENNDLGGFWAESVLHLTQKPASKKIQKILKGMATRPTPKLHEGLLLAKNKYVRFCMDSSDGLISCLLEMIRKQNLDVTLEIKRDSLSEAIQKAANLVHADPRMWALGWGGCCLVCAIPENQLGKIQNSLKKCSANFIPIGQITRGKGRILLKTLRGNLPLNIFPLITCEQFKEGGFWQLGIDKYEELMLSKNIESLTVKS